MFRECENHKDKLQIITDVENFTIFSNSYRCILKVIILNLVLANISKPLNGLIWIIYIRCQLYLCPIMKKVITLISSYQICKLLSGFLTIIVDHPNDDHLFSQIYTFIFSSKKGKDCSWEWWFLKIFIIIEHMSVNFHFVPRKESSQMTQASISTD